MTNPRKEYKKQFCESEFEKIFLDFAPSRLLDLYEPQVRIGPYRVDFAIKSIELLLNAIVSNSIIRQLNKKKEMKKRLII